MSNKNENSLSDKEKLAQYAEAKHWSLRQFCAKLDWSHNFFKSGSSFGVGNLRDIYHHPEMQDFNFDWFLFDQGEMIKSPEKLSDNAFNQEFIMNGMEMLATLDAEGKDMDQKEAKKLMSAFKDALKKLVSLSKDYKKLYDYIEKNINKRQKEKI